MADGKMDLPNTEAAHLAVRFLTKLGSYVSDREKTQPTVGEPREVVGPNSLRQGEPSGGRGVKEEPGNLSRGREDQLEEFARVSYDRKRQRR